MDRPRQIGSDSPSQTLESSLQEVRLLGHSSASCAGPLCAPLATVPTLASKERVNCLGTRIRITVLCLAFSRLYLSHHLPQRFSLGRSSSVLSCRQSCAAQDH